MTIQGAMLNLQAEINELEANLAGLKEQNAKTESNNVALSTAITGLQVIIDDLKAKLAAATPAPAPVPTPEPTPEEPPVVIPDVIVPPSGVLTHPTAVQNMYEATPGEWRTRADFPALGVATWQLDLGDIPHGTTVRVALKRKTNIVYGSKYNHKPLRVWPKRQIGGYPNLVAGTQVDGSMVVFYHEKLAGIKGVDKFYVKWPAPTGDWVEEVWMWRSGSAVGKADGMAFLSVGGKVLVDAKGYQTDNSTYPGVANYLCIQDVCSPQAGNVNRQKLPADAFTSYKDIRVTVTRP